MRPLRTVHCFRFEQSLHSRNTRMATVTKVSGIEMLRSTNYRPQDGWRVLKDNEFIEVESHGQTFYYKVGEFLEGEDVIFLVNRNSDFTEGRGPMIFDSAFKNIDDAVEYILGKQGLGSKQSAQNYPGISIEGQPYVVSGFSGYEIKIVKLR